MEEGENYTSEDETASTLETNNGRTRDGRTPIRNEEGEIVGWRNPRDRNRQEAAASNAQVQLMVVNTLKAVQNELKDLKESSQKEKIQKLEEKLEKEKRKKRKSNEAEGGYASDEELVTLREGKLSFKYKDQDGKEKKTEINFKDDGDQTVATEARALLGRQPNSEPKKWWDKNLCAETTPRTGENLNYDHLLLHKVNPHTVFKTHDPAAVPEIKEFSFSNSGFGRRIQKSFRLETSRLEGMQIKSGGELKDLKSIHDLLDAGWNLVMITGMLRAHDYGPRVIMWTLHHVHIFVGVSAGDEGLQFWYVERFMNGCINKNNTRARRGNPPLTVNEALDEVKKLVMYKQGDLALLGAGEVYSVIGKRNERNNANNGNNSNNGNGGNGRTPPGGNRTQQRNPGNDRARQLANGNSGKVIKSTKDKVKECCGPWNDAGGDTCTFGAACTRDHKCNYVNEKGRVCWKPHPRCQHGKPAAPAQPKENGD